jgi:hypothetical protein
MEPSRVLDECYLSSVAIEDVNPDDIGRQCLCRRLSDDRTLTGDAGVNPEHAVNERMWRRCYDG